MPVKEFQQLNNYETLSIKDKLQYEILNYDDVIKLENAESLFEAGEYYAQIANETGSINEQKLNLDYSQKLFEKTVSKESKAKFYMSYLDVLLEVYDMDSTKQDVVTKIKEQSNKLFQTKKEKDEMLKVANYYNKDIKKYKDFKFYDKALELYKTLLKDYPQDTTLREEIAGNGLANLAGPLIEVKKFQLALYATKLALEANKNDVYVIEALPLCYLLNNEFEKARQLYLEWKDKPGPDEDYKTYKEAFLEDIDFAEKEGITHPDFKKIKELLNK